MWHEENKSYASTKIILNIASSININSHKACIHCKVITINKLMTIFIPSLATIAVLLSFSLFVVVVRALNSLSKFEVYMWHLKVEPTEVESSVTFLGPGGGRNGRCWSKDTELELCRLKSLFKSILITFSINMLNVGFFNLQISFREEYL